MQRLDDIEMNQQDAKIDMDATGFKCSICGCILEPYEIFAQRIRKIKKPACIGCLADIARDTKNILVPLLEGALEKMDPRG